MTVTQLCAYTIYVTLSIIKHFSTMLNGESSCDRIWSHNNNAARRFSYNIFVTLFYRIQCKCFYDIQKIWKARIINFHIVRKASIIGWCLYLDIIIAFDNFEYNNVYPLMNFGIILFSVFVILLLPTPI